MMSENWAFARVFDKEYYFYCYYYYYYYYYVSIRTEK